MSDTKTQSLKVFFGPQQAPLSAWWWLGIPVAIFVVQLILEATLSKEMVNNIVSENGIYEIIQAVVAGWAAIVAAVLLMRKDVRADKLLFAWVGIAFLGCFYITGEEISWGQWILHWDTPTHWAEINDQGETNFHNTSSWLDQKPRLLLEIGIVVGGFIIPLMRRYKLDALPTKFNIFYPLNCMLPITLIGELGKFIEKFFELFDIRIFARFSEVHELYIYAFVLLYLIILRRRLISGF